MGNQAATATGKVEVTGLWVYPVKSCRGIALDEARLNKYGFEHDREWMVVTEQARDNLRSFVTLRQIPRMALVVPCFEVCTTTHAMPSQMLIISPVADHSCSCRMSTCALTRRGWTPFAYRWPTRQSTTRPITSRSDCGARRCRSSMRAPRPHSGCPPSSRSRSGSRSRSPAMGADR